jgi:hypothetical protein
MLLHRLVGSTSSGVVGYVTQPSTLQVLLLLLRLRLWSHLPLLLQVLILGI